MIDHSEIAGRIGQAGLASGAGGGGEGNSRRSAFRRTRPVKPACLPAPTPIRAGDLACVTEDHAGFDSKRIRRTAVSVFREISRSVSVDDLVQVGHLALLTTRARRPDVGAGYLHLRVRGAMIDAVRHQRKWDAKICSDDLRLLDVRDDAPDAAECHDRALLSATLNDEIHRLPARTSVIMRLYYEHEMSLAAIGRVFSLTSSRICQIRKGAERRLRRRLTSAGHGGTV